MELVLPESVLARGGWGCFISFHRLLLSAERGGGDVIAVRPSGDMLEVETKIYF